MNPELELPAGILHVGIDSAPPFPLQQGSPETGDFRGFGVDLLDALAASLQLTIEYRRADWSVIISELVQGRIDIVCSAATVTDHRSAMIDYSTPYLALSLVAVVRSDARGVAADLATVRVGVRAGTTAEEYTDAHGAATPAMVSESNDELYAALATAEIDVVIDDSPIAAYFVARGSGVRIGAVLPGTEAAYAMMVRQGNRRVLDPVNEAIAAMEEDGRLRRLRAKWRLPQVAE